MRAEELRIGNLLKHPFGVMSVQSIRGDDIGCYDEMKALLMTVLTNLKPIPLTEEWLLKFGFVYTGSEGYQAPHNTSLWYFSLGCGFLCTLLSCERSLNQDAFLKLFQSILLHHEPQPFASTHPEQAKQAQKHSRNQTGFFLRAQFYCV